MEGESAGGATRTAANLGDETSEEVRKRGVAVPGSPVDEGKFLKKLLTSRTLYHSLIPIYR